MVNTLAIEHRFVPGQPIYLFNRADAVVKTEIKALEIVVGLEKRVVVKYTVFSSDRSYAEDEVYGTIDEVLQAQREILERSE